MRFRTVSTVTSSMIDVNEEDGAITDGRLSAQRCYTQM